MAGAIAMLAVFFVTVIEMLFTRGLCKGGFSEPDHREATLELGYKNDKDTRADETDEKEEGNAGAGAGAVKGRQGSEEIGGAGGVGNVGFGMAGRRRSRSHSMSQGLQIYQGMEKDKREKVRAALGLGAGMKFSNNSSDIISQANECAIGDCEENGECGIECEKKEAIETHRAVTETTLKREYMPDISKNLTPEQIHKKALLQVGLLEMGILFHSVFIGMALSVTGGSGFIVLLIAITFHQTFEGLALGSRIAVLKWKPKAAQPWLMACAYGLT